MRLKPKHLLLRNGWSLVELMVALGGSSALLVGLTSTIFIAMKATDTSTTPTTATIEGNAALMNLLTELEFAISFSEKTLNATTFTVPDRDGNASAETIRYAWSGTPGDSLTRQYNGGTVTSLVENVHSLAFQYFQPSSAVQYVTVKIQVTGNPKALVETSIRILNRP